MIWLGLGTAWAATLSGTVLDVEGDPIAGAYVAVYDEALAQVAVEGPTLADGRWRAEVGAGRHRVRVVPGMALNVVESWEPEGVTDACLARVHPLFERSVVSDAVVTLGPGLGISGTLVSATDAPISGARVTAVPIGGGTSIQLRQAVSNSAGRFQVAGLPPERSWNLDVEATGHPDQYIPGVYSRFSATAFDGAAGSVTEAGTATLLPGITVGGVLTGPGGPIIDARVSAYSPNQIETARTDEAGRYEIVGLPPGEVTAWSTPDAHAKTYYPADDRPGPRVSVPDEGAVYLDLDIHAPLEARLDGRLLGDGDLSVATVLLYNDARTVGFGGRADVDGRFSIGALHGGDWLLQVDPSLAGYLPGFVGGDASPTPFAVPAQGVAQIEAELVPAVDIDGTVRRADGEPAYDALVTATSRLTGTAYRTRTDHDGAYRLVGLPGGDTWDLSAEGDPPCPDDPDRVRFWFPGTPDPEAKVGLALRSGDVLTWSVTLPDDVDGDGMDDAWEVRWGLDPTRGDALDDPDGDGNPNLVEYWVDDDPFRGPGACAGRGGSAALVLLLPLWLGRRRPRGVQRGQTPEAACDSR